MKVSQIFIRTKSDKFLYKKGRHLFGAALNLIYMSCPNETFIYADSSPISLNFRILISATLFSLHGFYLSPALFPLLAPSFQSPSSLVFANHGNITAQTPSSLSLASSFTYSPLFFSKDLPQLWPHASPLPSEHQPQLRRPRLPSSLRQFGEETLLGRAQWELLPCAKN